MSKPIRNEDLVAAVIALTRARTPLTASHLRALTALEGQSEPITSATLAAVVKWSPGRASSVLGMLVKRGYVRSVRDTDDRRLLRLSLSNTGTTLLARVRTAIAEHP